MARSSDHLPAPRSPGEPVRGVHGRVLHAAVHEIVQTLEEDIVLGRIHPRERLVEDALIARFASKRHSVREALAELERMGLLERLPNRGAVVRELSPTEVENIYAVRELLELAAARAVRRRTTPELVRRLTEIQRRHDAAIRAQDLARAFRLNLEFHRAFFEACGNPELVEAIETFGQKAHAIRSLSLSRADYLRTSGDEHWSIIRALDADDGDALVRLCREHIHVAKRIYIDACRARLPKRSSEDRHAAALPHPRHKATMRPELSPHPIRRPE